ncbi:DUF885 domain-containing protein [Actinocorallia longicatena]|uniref:DUF885 domain-containing protein n=1 Tax=Actinocorallia longicatena TaxID=111803 RepID=A0ABP6QBQ6_9ACTN
MTEIDRLSDRYVSDLAAADPCLAAMSGISGQDGALTDYGPDGYAARADLTRRTLAELAAAPMTGEADRRAAAVLRDKLETFAALDEADVHALDFSNIDGPFQRLRQAVEVLDQGADSPWDDLRARIEAFPAALRGLSAYQAEARDRGIVAHRPMILGTVAQLEGSAAYFRGFAERPGLDGAARAAAQACLDYGAFLTGELVPAAPDREGVGRDRYALGVRNFLGTTLDLEATYAWAWDELAVLKREMAEAAAEIAPGRSLAEVRDALDADPRHRIASGEPFRAWIQELADRAIADLDGVHFDIAEPLRRIDCRTPPTGNSIYYLAPAEDLSRPGQVWYSAHGAETTTWAVPSIMFHEGVPGHHLQLGATILNQGLTRFQRVSSELHPGFAEGWGLYAERLMDELGYFTDPAHRLGMLYGGRQIRTVRVIVDIGLHLGLTIPAGSGFHEGERWTRDLAIEFLSRHSPDDVEVVTWEIDRYLGLPAQAIAYKLGEKVWLEGRAAARARHGSSFDLKSFHSTALDLGPMGLELLAAELAAV